MRNLLIIGGGQAAIRTALSLREIGYGEAITLVGDEPHAPYERPPLSKEVLLGKTTPEACAIASPDRLAEAGLRLHLGHSVVEIEPAPGAARLSDGRSLAFDSLLLATGAKPRRLGLPGAEAAGIFILRGQDDAMALRLAAVAALAGGSDSPVVIIGGGFLGLEVAASLSSLGLAVTVLESAPQLLHGRLPTAIAAWLQQWHERHGVTIRTNAQPLAYEITGNGHVAGLLLADGERLPCRLVLEAVGAVPNTDLGASLGLDCTSGILADAQGRTALPRIFTAGDVARWLHPRYDRPLRLESWQAAQLQGAAVAKAMLGVEAPFNAVPWFWSGQHDAMIHIAGLLEDGITLVQRGNLDGNGPLGWFGLKQGRLRLAVTVNAMADARVGQNLIERGFQHGLELDPARLADPGQRLRSLAA